MKPTVSFGRIGGIPVGAHWSALVGVVLLGELLALSVLPSLVPGLALMTYLLAGAVAAVALVLSLLVHELTHALVARHSGVGVRRITLWLLGGVSDLAEPPQRPAAEIRIAVVGPLASLALAGVFAAAVWGATRLGAPELVEAVLVWLTTANIALGVFNLLPGAPLDGGRVLHGLLWWRTGDRERATRITSGAGQVLGALLAGLAVVLVVNGRWDGLWLALVGWFLTTTAAAERAHGVLVARLAGLRAGDVMTRDPHLAPGWWTVQALIDQLLMPGSPRQGSFPVIDFDGRPRGIVRLRDLAAVDPAARITRPVRDVARPLPADLVVEATDPLEGLLERPLGRDRDVVVQRAGRVVGVITPADLQLTAELRALRADDPAWRPRRRGPGGIS